MSDPKTVEREGDGKKRATYEARDVRTLVDGRPIPYVATWTPEIEPDAFALKMDHRLSKVIPAFCDDVARGVGRVVLGVMNVERQRRVVLNFWCQVCASPLGKNGYAVELYEGTAEIIPPKVGRLASEAINGRVLREPPACAKCLIVALDTCPGLARALDDGAGILTLGRGSSVILATIHQEPDGPKMITYLKMVPLVVDRMVRTVDEFRAAVR